MTTTTKLDEKALEENRCKYKFSIWQPMHVTSWCCWKLYPLGCVKIWERLVRQLIARYFLNTRSCVRPVAAIVGLGRAAVRGRCRIYCSVFFKNHQSQSKYYCFSPGLKSNVECGPRIPTRMICFHDLLNLYVNNMTGAVATLAPLCVFFLINPLISFLLSLDNGNIPISICQTII